MEHKASTFMKRFNYLLGETNAVYHDMAQRLGLSDSIMQILYSICDNGTSCLLQDICRNSGLSKQTVNSALRKMEAEELVYLKPAGAKSKRVCLTEKGECLSRQTAGKVLKIENDILSCWAKEDVQKYLELTEAFLTALREKAKEL